MLTLASLGGCDSGSVAPADLAQTGDLAQAGDLTQAGDLALAANPCGSSVLCTKSAIADQSLELQATAQASLTVLSAPGYSGTVNITLDRTSIDALSGGKAPDVDIAVIPATFQLTAGSSKPVSVILNTTTAAAAFANQKVTLHVTDATDSTKMFDVPFNLTVRPQLTITYKGSGTAGNLHTWSTDKGNTINFNVRQRVSGGTNFVFLNKGVGLHSIRGYGVITYQNTAMPTPPDGTYTVSGANDVMRANTNGFECHPHPGSGSQPAGARYINFIP